MAALFEIDAEIGEQINAARTSPSDKPSLGWTDPDAAFAVVSSHIGLLEPQAALVAIGRYQSQLSAMRTASAAALLVAEGERGVKRALDDGKTAKAAVDRETRRADVAAKNPSVVDKMAAGDLSEDHLDVIAATSAKTDGAAAVDDRFIDRVAAKTPDQAKAVAAKFVEDHADPDGVQSHHDRQRANRRVVTFHNKKNGLATLKIEGDDVSIQNMWRAIKDRANTLYRNDGGRDVAPGDHPRSPDQRKFDAANDLLCGTTEPDRPTTSGPPGGDTTADAGAPASTDTGTNNNPATDDPTTNEAASGDTTTDTGDPASTETGTNDNPATGDPASSTPPAQPTRPAPRPQVFVGLTIDKLEGMAPDELATQFGLGLIPDSVLADYLARGDIFSVLYDRQGKPLWLARTSRHANLMQRYALIIRDKGCVLCGAHHSECDIHHRLPWHAPAKGETNLDNLVLLCSSCHRRLHDNNQTLYQDPTDTWRKRPATPAETPPSGKRKPKPTRNHPRRE